MEVLDQLKDSFEFNYLKSIVNRPLDTPVNLFMEGQSECATHAMKVITDLMVELVLLKAEYDNIRDDYDL